MKELAINCVMGIDPGSGGGIAIYIAGERFPEVRTAKMPNDISELGEFFGYYKENYKPIVFLEKLSVRPDDVFLEAGGKALGKLYRIQKMMANFEHLKALMETTGIPYVMVHPASWQTALKLRINGFKEEKRDRKRRYKDYAEKLYPQMKVTLWNADALLIMHFGRFALANKIDWVKAQLPEREYEKLF